MGSPRARYTRIIIPTFHRAYFPLWCYHNPTSPETTTWTSFGNFLSLMFKLKPGCLCPAGQETALVPIPYSFHSRTLACGFVNHGRKGSWLPLLLQGHCDDSLWWHTSSAKLKNVRLTGQVEPESISLNWGCNLTGSSSLKTNAAQLEGLKTFQGVNVKAI